MIVHPLFLAGILYNAVVPRVVAEPNPGDIVCRYVSITGEEVNYHTCTGLAQRYSINIENFFLLNLADDKECKAIKPNTEYCVDGCS